MSSLFLTDSSFEQRAGPKRLTPIKQDTFVSEDGVAWQFERDATGAVTGHEVQAGRVRNIGFVRQRRGTGNYRAGRFCGPVKTVDTRVSTSRKGRASACLNSRYSRLEDGVSEIRRWSFTGMPQARSLPK